MAQAAGSGIFLLALFQLLEIVLQSDMGAHDTRHRAFIGDRQGFVAKLVGALHQLLGMGSAALETEIADAVQFGVAR